MMNILAQIVEAKKKEVEIKKQQLGANWQQLFANELNKTCVSLMDNLLKENSTGIIAEFKRKSPSKGWFKNADYPSTATILDYEKYGAAGASILTDTDFFGGNDADITLTKATSSLPLLRKDFIIDEIQIQEAKIIGADVILLIAAILSPTRVVALATEAKKYGLEILLELHEEAELNHICYEVDMVGINNRNLKTFEVDIEHSLRLAKQIPDTFVKVAESGIDNVNTIKLFKDEGYKGFLIGECFMKEKQPGIAFKNFIEKLNYK